MTPRRDPFEQMERMFDQMRRAMWEMNPALEAGAGEFEGGPRELTSGDVNLSLEEAEDEYVVVADLPGFETDELDLRYDDGVLVISGTHEVPDDGGYRSRRVHERVTLPGAVDAEEIAASYRNGVLEVRLPLLEADADTGHHIDVE